MIPGLLHGRLFGGAGGPTPEVSAPNFADIYTAQSSGSHNTGAGITLTVSANGSWDVVMSAAPGGVGGSSFTSGVPISGPWLNSGVASDYEIMFTAIVADDLVTEGGNFASWTETTGWMNLGTSRQVSANTGNYANGDDEATGTLSGRYLVDIRRVGTSDVISAPFDFQLNLGNQV